MQVQSVSHNLIKYTHGYLIAASKNQKEPFLDIQNQNPRMHLMPPSVEETHAAVLILDV